MLGLLDFAVEEIFFRQALPAFPVTFIPSSVKPKQQDDGRQDVIAHVSESGNAPGQPIDCPRSQIEAAKCVSLETVYLLVRDLRLVHEYCALTVLIPIFVLGEIL